MAMGSLIRSKDMIHPIKLKRYSWQVLRLLSLSRNGGVLKKLNL